MLSSADIFRYLRFSKDVGQLYERCIETAAAACSLTKPEADVLLFLANSPHLDTARDACQYRGFSKAYVSKAVEQLCARGFLRAAVSAEDRRIQRLSVQHAADAAVGSLQAAQQAFFEMLTGGFSQEEEAAVLSALSRISDNVRAARREA